MLIIAEVFLVLIVCLGIECLTKNRWLRVGLVFALVVVTAIAVFRVAIEAGAGIQRADDSRMVADNLEYFEEATQTNSLPEIRAKLSIFRHEIPIAIASGEPNTPKLLAILGVEIPTNAASMPVK